MSIESVNYEVQARPAYDFTSYGWVTQCARGTESECHDEITKRQNKSHPDYKYFYRIIKITREIL